MKTELDNEDSTKSATITKQSDNKSLKVTYKGYETTINTETGSMTSLAKTDASLDGDSSLGGGDAPVTPTVISVTELRKGDEVIYTDQNGTEIPCIVLYDSTGSYGIQIISADTKGNDIELGNGTENSSESSNELHFATAKESWNTAIAKLNIAAQNYINTNLSPTNGARCVGSSPGETPITNENNTGTYTTNNPNFSSYNNQFKTSSTNNTFRTNEDWLQMKSINCYNISKNYWLACRNVGDSSDFKAFRMIYISDGGAFSLGFLVRLDKDGTTISWSNTMGLRPIFILKSDIHYVEENGVKTLVP